MDEEEFLPLSGVQHVVYCERRFALVHVERIWAESAETVDGKQVHQRSDDPATESRDDLRVARGLLVRSTSLGLSGKADVVEFHRLPPAATHGALLEGVVGRWQPFPVEYKRGEMRHEDAYAIQLCAQAIALEEMLATSVPAGAIYYGASRRRVEVRLDDDLRHATADAARRIHEIVASGITPAPVHGPKCKRCSMSGLCVPRLGRQRLRAEPYLAGLLQGQTGDDAS